MRSLTYVAGLVLALAALPALAQAPQGTRMNIRGKLAKVEGQTITVKTREGATDEIALAPNTAVRALARKKLSDIKDGDYIASTSLPGKDGKLHALEIHFLPPAVPELQTPYDLKEGSVMTNAHVNGIAKATGGTTLSLTYKGTATAIVVDPKTVIVGQADATMADLKLGKAVMLRAVKAADGTITADNITVEKNGVKPPM